VTQLRDKGSLYFVWCFLRQDEDRFLRDEDATLNEVFIRLHTAYFKPALDSDSFGPPYDADYGVSLGEAELYLTVATLWDSCCAGVAML
jgi:hypothetical protein